MLQKQVARGGVYSFNIVPVHVYHMVVVANSFFQKCINMLTILVGS